MTLQAITAPQLDAGEEWIDTDAVRRLLEAHLTTTSATQKVVADGIGVSAAAISQFRAGKYAGDTKGLARKLAAYLATSTARSNVQVSVGFVETSIARGVLSAVRYAEIMGRIVCVMGAPGMGKTTSLKEYCRRNPSVLYLSAHQGVTGPKAFVEELAEVLKVSGRGTLRVQLKAVVDTLRGTNRLVIVDEAQKLNAPVLETLRDIHDQTGVGMVLAGNLEIHPLLQRRGAGQFAQLLSRIAVQHRVPDEVPPEDVRQLSEASVGSIDNQAVEVLTALANAPAAGLRRAANVLPALVGLGRTVTADDVRKATRMVGR